jgi:hypothetical protein
MSNYRPVAKAQPTFTEVHVDRPLTDLSLAYLQDENDFVADKVFPTVPVQKASDLYFSYDKAYWLKSDAQKRAVGGPAARSGYGITTASYACTRDAIAHAIPDPIRNQADIADLDREAVLFVNEKIRLAKEISWAAKYFVTGVWGTSNTPSVLWDDAASDPVQNIKTGKRTVKTNTGKVPNTLVLGYKTLDDLLEHPDIIDRIKYGQTPGAPAVASEVALAQIFGVDRVLVCRAIQNTAVEGATASLSFVAGSRNALLVYTPSSPGLMTPAAGYTFAWAGGPGCNAAGMAFRTYRDNTNESDIVEGECWYDQKLVAADLGYAFINAVAA